jgi:hypothetical protein
LRQLSEALADFALKWAERNGGVPKSKAAIRRYVADLFLRFPPPANVPHDLLPPAIAARQREWAKARGIKPGTRRSDQQFDDETGLLTRAANELSVLGREQDLARRIGVRLGELSRAAVALGCDDATAAALKGGGAIFLEVAEGRVRLEDPTTWREARLQASAICQSEAIAGIPVNLGYRVGLDRLEAAARGAVDSPGVAAASTMPKPSDADMPAGGSGQGDGDDRYLPASSFPKTMRPRLRQAARPLRKSKRVRSKRVNGVVLYSLRDAQVWWPHDCPA